MLKCIMRLSGTLGVIIGYGASRPAGITVIKFYADFVARSQNSSLDDQPIVLEPSDGFTKRREQDLNAGFIEALGNGVSDTEYRVRLEQGEAAPKLSLRVRINTDFATASLILLLSDRGGKVNDATYDV